MRVDSHHHFWNYSPEQYGWISEQMQPLQRDFGPADLSILADQTKINGVVSVQARQTIEETRWLLEIARKQPLVWGVVGWLPLRSKDVESIIEEWTHDEYLKSARHVVHDEPDDAFILGEDFNRGVSLLKNYGLVYDILIFAKHLKNTIEFVDRHPEQMFVVDHIAKPNIRADQFDETWKRDLIELGKRPHVTCKFSGVVTEVRDADWDVELLRPYWDSALEAFGADRLMFGSDWPVCLLRSSYQDWVRTVEQLASSLSHDEQSAFWAQNAIRTYSLR
ncbi:MAG: amidohydrolase family protein [bacterium]|nr:amidohydrolase family protein [bacterium]